MASLSISKGNNAFLDASVLFAASISARGSARELVVEGLLGRHLIHSSPFALDEAELNLRRKAPRALTEFQIFRLGLTDWLISPSESLVLRVAQVVALKDAPIVAGAVAAGATHLATYDRKHLLSHRNLIHQSFGIEVATPEEILRLSSPGSVEPG